tara:strand:- start:69 stop:371 length:303 start_codon:yes stop_codon:yes gene_type:complete
MIDFFRNFKGKCTNCNKSQLEALNIFTFTCLNCKSINKDKVIIRLILAAAIGLPIIYNPFFTIDFLSEYIYLEKYFLLIYMIVWIPFIFFIYSKQKKEII